MRVCVPTPGMMKRAAASLAGASSSSPATETPPPMITSSGSKMFTTLAMPTPRRSPRMRMHSRASGSPERAARGHVLQRGMVGLALGARRGAVGEVGGDEDVAQLRGGAGDAAVDAPADDDAAAHAGADRDHH